MTAAAAAAAVEPASPWPLAALHYAAPIVLTIYFLAFAPVCFILRRPVPPMQPEKNSRLRTVTFVVILALLASYTADSAICIAHALVQKGWWASQDTVIHILSSLLLWSGIALFLLETPLPRWPQYLGTFLLAAVQDVALCALNPSPATQWDSASLCVQVLRITLLAGGSAYGLLSLAGSSRKIAQKDEEGAKLCSGHATGNDQSRPLLGPQSSANGHANGSTRGAYGSIPEDPRDDDVSEVDSDDSDEDKEDREIKEKLQKRFAEEGVFGYLKSFSLFLPYLWPSKERTIQLYFVFIGLCVGAERVMNVFEPRQEGLMIDKLTRIHETGEMPWKEVGLWLLLYFVNSSDVIGQIQGYFEVSLSNWTYQQMVNLTFTHIMGLSMDFHDSKDSGELIKAVDQANALNELVRICVFEMGPIVIDLVIALWYVAYFYDAYFAFIIVAMTVAYLFVTYRGTASMAGIRRGYAENTRTFGKLQYESISNWATVSYFNRGPFEQNRLMTSLRNQISSSMSLWKARAFVDFAQGLCLFLSRVVMSYLSAYRVSQGLQTVGDFTTLNSYWSVIIRPLWLLSYTSRDITNNLVDAERVLQLMQTRPSVPEKEGASPLRVSKGMVEFKNVGFHYDERKTTIKDVSFTALPGQTIALVGETGSGKSTLFRLLYRFYDIDQGSICIDGQDVRDVTVASLRDALGMVPQDATLFNDSILENVRYARLDATEEEVHAACRAASIHDKILSFPDGYRTKVGERGVKLSGGELQRISIARILLKAPQIVLLDEATSAVDSTTESIIQDAFSKLTEGRTTFVIAHRLSTIMDADLILVMDKGVVVERGTHSELLSIGGKYSELWRTQTENHKKSLASGANLLVL